MASGVMDYGDMELDSMLNEIACVEGGALEYTDDWGSSPTSSSPQDFNLDDFNTEMNFGEGIDLEKLCQEVLNSDDVSASPIKLETNFSNSPTSSSFSDSDSIEAPAQPSVVTVPVYASSATVGEQIILPNGVRTRVLKVSRNSPLPLIVGRSGVLKSPTKIRIVRGASLSAAVQSNMRLTAEQLKQFTVVRASRSPSFSESVDEVSICSPASSGNAYDDINEGDFKPLILTDEERKIMIQEKITLPSHYPLTREEERNLRKIRRKIRNKRSAENSRKKKQIYVQDLEKRVKLCMMEKANLQKRVSKLESENASLLSQLKSVHTTMAGLAGKAAPTSTAFLVLMVSMAMLMAPNMNISSKFDADNALETQEVSQDTNVNSAVPASPHKRMLLSDNRNLEETNSLERVWRDLAAFKKSFSFLPEETNEDISATKRSRIDLDPGEGLKRQDFLKMMGELMDTDVANQIKVAEEVKKVASSTTVYLQTNGTRAI
ncbi:unnamed protein product [Notodromas monacha]|uniref:BZIP domain-containing protein n=1 Tax=Notodromas monacha TaxID=399045 RepID=A0A7R9BGW3_9CRUS|nr:unnamed protein product [Notodromas monacha]CAG0914160.1 unnamed protein product [Notodromas monacha]